MVTKIFILHFSASRLHFILGSFKWLSCLNAFKSKVEVQRNLLSQLTLWIKTLTLKIRYYIFFKKCVCTYFVGVRKRLVKANSLPLSSRIQGSNAGLQAWRQVHWAAEPSHWPQFKYFSLVLRLNCKCLISHFIFTSQNQNYAAVSREGRIPSATQEEGGWLTGCLILQRPPSTLNTEPGSLCVQSIFQSTDVFLLAETAA